MGSTQNTLKFGVIAVNLAYFKVDIEVRYFSVAKTKLIPPHPLPIIPFSESEGGREHFEFFPNQHKKMKRNSETSQPPWNEVQPQSSPSPAPDASALRPAVRSMLRSLLRWHTAVKELERSMFNFLFAVPVCALDCQLQAPGRVPRVLLGLPGHWEVLRCCPASNPAVPRGSTTTGAEGFSSYK